MIPYFFKKHKTGIECLDNEHEALFFHLKAMFYIASGKQGGDINIAPQLEMFLVKIKKHFQNEEALMKLISFSELEPHKKEHQRLVGEFMMELDESAFNKDASGFQRKLETWLESHILEWDKKIMMPTLPNNRVILLEHKQLETQNGSC